MKKLLFLLTTCAGLSLQAQFGWHFSAADTLEAPREFDIHLGVDFTRGSGGTLGSSYSVNSMNAPLSETRLFGNLGSGIALNGGVTQMFGDDLAGPINHGYGIGVRHFMGQSTLNNETLFENGDRFFNEIQGTYSALTFDFLMRTCCRGRLNGESNLGAMVSPIGGYKETDTRIAGGNTVYERETNYRFFPSLGINAGAGVSYTLNNGNKIHVNIGTTLFNPMVGSAKYTVYNNNGNDMLPTLQTYAKEWDYERTIDRESNTALNPAFDPTKPTQALTFRQSFNSTRFGIRYSF